MNSDRASGYSILIPWCNRDEISLTLKQNAPWLSVHQAEVLVVNCGGDSDRLSELLRPSPIDYLRRIDIPAATFNKALALNVGLHLSQRDKVFVLDADILLQSDLLTEFDRIVDASTFATVKRVYESVPQVPDLLANIADKMAGSFLADISYTMTVELSFADGSSIRQRTACKSLCDGSRPGAGLLAAKRSHLLKIGGYNSKLERWGWEDDDVQVRLRRTALLQQVESGVVLHLSHGDDRRALYGQSRDHADMRNFSLCCEQYADANFMGTYLQDVEVWKDRVVELFECPPDSPLLAPVV